MDPRRRGGGVMTQASVLRATRAGRLFLAAALTAGPLRAFDEFSVGARPAALSGAFTAVADDVHGLYYNPAGLALLPRPELTAYYARLFPNLSDQTRTALTFLGGACPLPFDGRWGGAGVGYTEFRVDSLYKERQLVLGYGRSLLADRLSLGVGLKSLQRVFGDTADTLNAFSGNNPGNRTGAIDPVFQGGHGATAVGLDVGALYQLFPQWRLGLALANLNRPDLGLANDEKLPLIARMGVAYQPKFMTVSADLTRRTFLNSRPDNRIHLGVERGWLFRRYGTLSLRGGAGFGGRDYRQVTLGAGYEVNGVVLDYVFTVPLGALDQTGNTHNIGLSYKFGRAPAEDELLALIVEERDATARAEEALRLAEAESAFVKDERNRLLQEYTAEIDRLKREAELKKPAAAPANRVLTPEERARLAREKALREYAAAFDAAYRGYQVQVERGATLTARLEKLNALTATYRDKGIDLSRAFKEVEKVKTELAQVSTDYRLTLDFYRKNAAQGADAQEQISLLERMIKKYARAGIDLSEAQKELAKLKGGK